MDLSTDHKPNLPDERKRIRNAGGRLTRDSRRVWCGGLGGQARVQYGPYRVNGDLAMSRSIGIILFDLFLISCILAFYLFSLYLAICISGDFRFKSERIPVPEQMVTCNPDVRTVSL
jgi:hypothetical protein